MISNRVQNAIDILLDAYNNNTLCKGTCKACAVGNIIAKTNGYEVIVPKNKQDWMKTEAYEQWAAVVLGGSFKDKELGEKLIRNSSFTWQELTEIEKLFEENTDISVEEYEDETTIAIKADQLKGLTAVINYLLELDNVEDKIEEVFTSKLKVFI